MSETCGNCLRPLTSRECADPVHREAQGKANVELDGKRTCIRCGERKPIEKFWAKKPGARHRERGHLYKSCGECRFKSRQQSKQAQRAQWRIEKAASDAFWASQRERELSHPGSP